MNFDIFSEYFGDLGEYFASFWSHFGDLGEYFGDLGGSWEQVGILAPFWAPKSEFSWILVHIWDLLGEPW